jgi:Xaa-Pro aminopeptidase
MDIHDSVTLPKDRPLEPGVVSPLLFFLWLIVLESRAYSQSTYLRTGSPYSSLSTPALLVTFPCAQVITIEPGIYIPPAPILKESAPERYRGVGIRIEDEVLVTETGHEVM